MKDQTAKENMSAKPKQNITTTRTLKRTSWDSAANSKLQNTKLFDKKQAAGVKLQEVLLQVPYGVLALAWCRILSLNNCCRTESSKKKCRKKQTNYKMILITHLRCCIQCSRPSLQCICNLLKCSPPTPRSLQGSPSRTSKWQTLEPAWRHQSTLQRLAPEMSSK